ncbi:unnamed protein product [Closterium sp. Yama58-4]|nr:unnamed protein product [Closterium sp. Yama58-4]
MRGRGGEGRTGASESISEANGGVREEEEEEEDQGPASPSVKRAEESGVDIVHEARAKIYVQKAKGEEGPAWKDKGSGTVIVKLHKGGASLRASVLFRNDVGKVMLNAPLYKGITIMLKKNNITAVLQSCQDDTAPAGATLDKSPRPVTFKLASVKAAEDLQAGFKEACNKFLHTRFLSAVSSSSQSLLSAMAAFAVCSASVVAPTSLLANKSAVSSKVAATPMLVSNKSRVVMSAEKKQNVALPATAALLAAAIIPEIAEAAQPGVSPSLQNLINSVIAGGVVLGAIAVAIIGVSNFDPVKRK